MALRSGWSASPASWRPDAFSASGGRNGIRAFLKIRGKWQLAWKGVAKPNALDHTQMLELFIPLPEPKLLKAEALRLEYYGYGGCGIAYACIVENGTVTRRPEAVIALDGEVSHPEYLLTDDSRTAFMGDQNMSIIISNQEKIISHYEITEENL